MVYYLTNTLESANPHSTWSRAQGLFEGAELPLLDAAAGAGTLMKSTLKSQLLSVQITPCVFFSKSPSASPTHWRWLFPKFHAPSADEAQRASNSFRRIHHKQLWAGWSGGF